MVERILGTRKTEVSAQEEKGVCFELWDRETMADLEGLPLVFMAGRRGYC